MKPSPLFIILAAAALLSPLPAEAGKTVFLKKFPIDERGQYTFHIENSSEARYPSYVYFDSTPDIGAPDFESSRLKIEILHPSTGKVLKATVMKFNKWRTVPQRGVFRQLLFGAREKAFFSLPAYRIRVTVLKPSLGNGDKAQIALWNI